MHKYNRKVEKLNIHKTSENGRKRIIKSMSWRDRPKVGERSEIGVVEARNLEEVKSIQEQQMAVILCSFLPLICSA